MARAGRASLTRSLSALESRSDLFCRGRKVVVGLPPVSLHVSEKALNDEQCDARVHSAMTELDGNAGVLQQTFDLSEQPSNSCDRSVLRRDSNRTAK